MNANEHHIRGDDYYYGRNGFEKDERKASEHWLKGAELDNVQCMKNMAWVYRDGIGITPSLQMSQFWTERHKGCSTYFSDPEIRQDKWVESAFDGKREGFFVEIGASDGVGSSNCCMLERRLDWSGICIEPNPDFYAKLCENRNAICLNRPVAPTERDVEFCLAGYYGGIQDNLSSWHEKEWKGKPKIKMRTQVLADILDEHNAPSVIDYLSLDIEGGEADIIETFPFDRYMILTMTIEQSQPRLVDVVKSKGFQVVKNPFSKPHVDWELHCIHESLT